MTISNNMNLSNVLMQNQMSRQEAQTLENKMPAIEDIGQKDIKRAQLEEVAKEFEKIFVNMMFTAMRDTLRKEDDIFYSGISQDIFDDMLYEEYAEQAASTNVLGFGKMIINEYEKYL